MLTAQLLGGTLGMAILDTLLGTTDSYRAVLLATAALTAAALAIGWLVIKRPARAGQTKYSADDAARGDCQDRLRILQATSTKTCVARNSLKTRQRGFGDSSFPSANTP